MQKLRCFTAAAALACVSGTAFGAHHEGADNKSVAEGWWNAGCGDLKEFIAYADKHMADDGYFYPARYVGLGFTVNNDEGEDFGMVMRVTQGSPAEGVLEKGDVFVSVNGLAMTPENRDKTTFRGKPGEVVEAVIRRDGKEMPISVERGVIATKQSKERAMEGLSLADAETWPSDSCKIHEVIGEGNVVYVYGESENTEEDTGYAFTSRDVVRFEFNDEGKIAGFWTMGEDRFVLEQLGYTISR